MRLIPVPYGKRFGRLVVIADGGKRGRSNRYWICGCDCGQLKAISASNIVYDNAKSCGCRARMIHGLSKRPEYDVWVGMIQRCHNPNNIAYARYGGRGITVCPARRHDFVAFYDHIGPRPDPLYSIERINNEQGYVPRNVRWATAKEQQRNRRTNTLITYKGQTRTLTEWVEMFGLRPSTLRRRLQYAWPLATALTAVPQRRQL